MVQFVIRSSQKLINYDKANTSIGFGIHILSNYESFYASKADLIDYGTTILYDKNIIWIGRNSLRFFRI